MSAFRKLFLMNVFFKSFEILLLLFKNSIFKFEKTYNFKKILQKYNFLNFTKFQFFNFPKISFFLNFIKFQLF